jgi:hypothetical protein
VKKKTSIFSFCKKKKKLKKNEKKMKRESFEEVMG